MFLLFVNTLDNEERSKLEKLYNKYKNLMMYISLDILKNEILAEETVHDAIISLSKVINDIDEIDSHRAYGLVILVTRRCSFNKLKYEKRRYHYNDEIIENMESESKPVEETVTEKINFENIVRKMKELSELDFEIVILKYYYGYTYKEIAARVEMKESTARKRCERARKRILESYTSAEDEL